MPMFADTCPHRYALSILLLYAMAAATSMLSGKNLGEPWKGHVIISLIEDPGDGRGEEVVTIGHLHPRAATA